MVNKNSQELYNDFKALMQKAADLNNSAALLSWDQETYMPPKSADIRGQQLATLSTLAHEMLTGGELEKLIGGLSAAEGLDEEQLANVRIAADDFEKNKKLPSSFVERMSRLTSDCFNAWIAARKQNDFQVFAPLLGDMVKLKREQAELYGYKDHPYDALIDDYEKGATVAMLDPLFARIREQLPPLLEHIRNSKQVSDNCFHQFFPKQGQEDFSYAVITAMGYDLFAGRQDYSEHPFTTSFSPEDVRITTRVDEQNFAFMLWSTIHEAGHALYEQGLPVAQYGMPLGSPASLSIHESQSRFWENCIGRGRDFWSHFYLQLQSIFPAQLGNVSLETFYNAMNRVSPSLIRTEADEVTYHFHVMIRYEIEKALISGKLDAKDLPAAWNEQYKKYLGITPEDDKRGVLQDVHWSHGSFGYFPTYSLGSFYAAQFYDKARQALPDLAQSVKAGQFGTLLKWLRVNIHQHGRRYTSEELCERVTGSKLDTNYFINYVNEKYRAIYV